MKRGVLLINIGTPSSPNPKDVGQYLGQFLMDEKVIQAPFFVRWLLVRCLIVPLRRHRSSSLYRSIWTERGSPLMVNCLDLRDRLREQAPEVQFELGMRYGEPSISEALECLKRGGVTELVILPLYPQFAESTTTSALLECERSLAKIGFNPDRKIISDFYDCADFISVMTRLVLQTCTVHQQEFAQTSSSNGSFPFDHLMMTFHGLPESHLRKLNIGNGKSGACFSRPDCCLSMRDDNRWCYRAQCYATAQALYQSLQSQIAIRPDQYSVAFQSRLGPTKWTGPSIDEMLDELIERGVRHLAVVSPSFTADCLETIEEIGETLRARFLSLGGKSFTRVPCPNGALDWVEMISKLSNQSFLKSSIFRKESEPIGTCAI
jgi:ferrochelatase